MFYVYRHIRLDTGLPFYVGKGKGSLKRAKNRTHRNIYWKRIVAKTNYRIEIMFKNLTEEAAFKKEMDFIKLYKSLGMCEANMTYGGEGTSGLIKSEEVRQKIASSHGAKPFIVYNKLGEVVGCWSNMHKCARDLGVLKPHIYQILHGKAKRRSSRGYIFKYLEVS